MELEKNPIIQGGDDDSLEAPGTTFAGASGPPVQKPPEKTPLLKKLGKSAHRVNIYLLMFVLLVIVAGLITFISIQSSRRNNGRNDISGQELSEEALAELSKNNVQVGDPKQTLTIASNSIFNGKVLVRDSLDVAGALRIGGALSLPGITVSGTSNFEDVQVSSNISTAGNVTAEGNLNVAGSGSFSGALSAASINTENLALNNNLTLSRHIVTSGGVPGVSVGTAVGGGGTVSLSGSDIAGTITINTGGGPAAGVLANVSFSRAYSRTPHVVVTPVGSSAAGLNFYVTRTANGFTLATTNAPPAAKSFSFDYIVIN